MKKVVAVLQARMGSTRLPGKMLLELAGSPLIDYPIGRLVNALSPKGFLDEIVMATSNLSANDVLVKHVNKTWPQVTIIRGEEEDVLSRFVHAISETGASSVVRATGDCPLLNLDAMKKMITALHESAADIVNYKPGYEYVDKGIEVFRADSLLSVGNDSRLTEYDREHVTSAFYKYSSDYNVRYIDSEDYLKRGDIRLTIDTPEDFEFFQACCNATNFNLHTITLAEIIQTLEKNPHLQSINQFSGRKSTRHDRYRLGFRCDGGLNIGLGHIVGSIRLAKLLAKEKGIGAEFILRNDPASLSLIREAGFAYEIIETDIHPEDDIDFLLQKSIASDWSGIVVNFCKDDLDRYSSYFHKIKKDNIPLIFMDNPVPSSYHLGDLLLNALPHPDYEGYQPDKHPACFDGLDYFISQSEDTVDRIISKLPLRILITMGGADPLNTTSTVLKALELVKYQGYVDVILGMACPHESSIRKQLQDSTLKGAVEVNVSDLPERMQKADLGFSALGLTTYEMACSKLPSCIITANELNSIVAEKYAKDYGCADYLGFAPDLTVDQIAKQVAKILSSFETRKMLSINCQKVGKKINELPTLIEKTLLR